MASAVAAIKRVVTERAGRCIWRGAEGEVEAGRVRCLPGRDPRRRVAVSISGDMQ